MMDDGREYGAYDNFCRGLIQSIENAEQFISASDFCLLRFRSKTGRHFEIPTRYVENYSIISSQVIKLLELGYFLQYAYDEGYNPYYFVGRLDTDVYSASQDWTYYNKEWLIKQCYEADFKDFKSVAIDNYNTQPRLRHLIDKIISCEANGYSFALVKHNKWLTLIEVRRD